MLRKIFLYTAVMCVISFTTNATSNNFCFIAKEKGTIIKQEGNCKLRHSPFSSFKIPLAVMGFDSGILKNPNEPVVPYDDEAKQRFASYYLPKKYPIQRLSAREQTPTSWLRYSVIWYSQYITNKLGMKKFQEYVNKFDYGNKNIVGNPDKNDGLLGSWIGSSLEISPVEQLNFIDKLANKKLPVSKEAMENTKTILVQENYYDDWELYGKTGGSMEVGWFVGWIEHNDRIISFAQYIEQPKETALISGGLTAKEVSKKNLIDLILK